MSELASPRNSAAYGSKRGSSSRKMQSQRRLNSPQDVTLTSLRRESNASFGSNGSGQLSSSRAQFLTRPRKGAGIFGVFFSASVASIFSVGPGPEMTAHQDFASSTEAERLEVDEASSKIAKFWWRRRFVDHMDKQGMIARLELEDSIGRRSVRLLVNSLIFVFLVRFLSLGNTSSEKLSVRTLLTGHLFDKRYYRIRTLDDLRDYLPILSHKARKFSVSAPTEARAMEDETLKVGSVLQGQRELFSGPISLSYFQPRITSSFTLSAWVEHPISSQLYNTSAINAAHFPILRQPMSSSRSLSCWGWFYPPQLRYGGHDFFSPTSTESEEVVRSRGWRPSDGEAVHEVMTVDQDTVTFYSNGEMAGQPVKLPRPLTECQFGRAVEMGDEGMALSSFKFYQRALTPREVSELYLGGQPLVELAAGIDLQEQAATAGDTSVLTDSEEIVNNVDEVGAEGQIRATMASPPVDGAGQKGWIDHPDPTFPPDPSPPAWLPGGTAKAEYLSPEERAVWESNGNLTGTGFLTELMAVDESGMEYYSVFDAPVYGDGTEVAVMPEFDANLEGITISFWMRALKPTRASGPHVHFFTTETEEYYRGSTCRREPTPTTKDINFRLELDWVMIDGRSGGQCRSAWWFLTWFDPATQTISEDFLVSSFAKEPRPLVWRHVAYQYDVGTGGWSFFLDGSFVYNTALHNMSPEPAPFENQNAHQMLSDAKLVLHSWSRGDAFIDIPAKIAQFRVYPSKLSREEIRAVQGSARWPAAEAGGVGVPVQECIDPQTDFNFFDTAIVDRFGHTCQWHQSHEQEFPFICNLSWLKRMCPVTCSGRRKCHGGQLSPEYATQDAKEFKKHLVFDRIMHITPENRSVICPRDDIDIRQSVEECRAKKESWGEDYGGVDNYTIFYENTYEKVKATRTDLRDCDQLEAALRYGREKCSWSGEKFRAFEEEVEAAGGEWAVTFWIRPKQQSTGMPANFWFAVSLYSSVSPPLVLSHWHETQPDLEPWLDAYTTVNDAGTVERKRSAIWPTTDIDYTQWSMMHMQMQKHNGKFRLCATLNNMPMECTPGLNPPAFRTWSPDSFMNAMEFSTEMLVSPFEFTTQMLSPSEVQLRYYRDSPQMALKLGPKVAREDLKADTQAAGFSLPDSDLRMGLLSPPVLFQSRAKAEACTSRIAKPFIDAQLALLETSYCFGDSCQSPDPRTVATCASDEREDGLYWGRTASSLRGEKGFSEFLSVIADNSVVVRTLLPDEPPAMLQTRYFLDGLTTEVHVVLLLLNPKTGLISLIDVIWDVSLPSVKSKIKISHLGTVMEDELEVVWREFSVLAAMLVLFALLNLTAFYRLRKENKRHKRANDKEFSEVMHGLLECCVVGAFAVWWLTSVLSSEDTSTEVVKQVAGVPWTSQTMDFDTKVSSLYSGVVAFDDALNAVFTQQTFAFFLLLFMLISIMQATAVHPKMRALTGSFMKSLDDLWHFGILAAIIFIFFATTGWWTFGGDRDDFRTGTETMTTQLNIILGVLPVNFNLDFRLSVYVMLTTAVFFLLMLNFLLAIVVEGYMKVRGEMEENKAAYEFFTDIALTAKSSFHKRLERWPNRRELIYVLKYKVSASKINGFTLRKLALTGDYQLTIDGTRKCFDYYFLKFPKLRVDGDELFDFEQVAEMVGMMHGLNMGGKTPKGGESGDGVSSQGSVGTHSMLERILQQMEMLNHDVGKMRDEMEAMKRNGGYRRNSNAASQLGSQPGYNSIVSTRRRLSVPGINEEGGGDQEARAAGRGQEERKTSISSDASEDGRIRSRKLSIPSFSAVSADLVIDNRESGEGSPFAIPERRHFMQDELSLAGGMGSSRGASFRKHGSKKGFVPPPANPQGSMRNQMLELSKMASYSGSLLRLGCSPAEAESHRSAVEALESEVGASEDGTSEKPAMVGGEGASRSAEAERADNKDKEASAADKARLNGVGKGAERVSAENGSTPAHADASLQVSSAVALVATHPDTHPVGRTLLEPAVLRDAVPDLQDFHRRTSVDARASIHGNGTH